MNLIRGAISTHQCLFLLPRLTLPPIKFLPPFSANSYSSTPPSLKSQPPKKPRTPKSKKQPFTPPPTWPKPTQIPYQPKLANSVTLFGNIQMPIKFHATPDGKHVAATFISQQNSVFKGNSGIYDNSVSIPVVFEGDLAHIVACHVKLNDLVYVTGKLSLDLDPLPFVEIKGKFFVIGNEINFVDSNHIEKKVEIENDNVVKGQDGNRESSVDKDSRVKKEWDEFFLDKINEWSVITSEDDGLKGAIEGFERKVDGRRIVLDSSTPVWVYKKLEELDFEDKIEETKIEPLKTEKKSYENVGGKTKDGDSILNSWRDLVKNPMDWRDYREKKSSGSVKANYPDFKHKNNGTALWLNRAPNWVLPGLEGLDVGGKGKIENSWKNLVENPDKWWDNRSRKTNIRAPDFKHKETGEVLWLNTSPEWAFSKLPPLENEQNFAAANKEAYVA